MPDLRDSIDSIEDLFGPPGPSVPRGMRRDPYKFLDPYGADDRVVFFGRDFDIAELYARVYSKRLLVLYGASGCGKTSLINCGLRAEVRPEDALFLSVRSTVDPILTIRVLLSAVLGGDDELRNVPTAQLLREAVFNKGKTFILVFDQFEELFLFHDTAARVHVADEIAAWLSTDIDVRIILSIREDFLAHVTEFEHSLPGILANRFWVRKMSLEQARDAIVEPCRRCGVDIDPELAGLLLDEMTRDGQGVELPILQVVLDTLYRRAVAQGGERPAITLDAYRKMGELRSILGRFIEDRVEACRDADSVRQVLKTMITSDGTKRPCSAADSARASGQFGTAITEADVCAIFARLVDARLIRQEVGSGLFELRHDALAAAVHRWMSGREKETAEVRRALEGRFREHQARRRDLSTFLDAAFLDYLAPYLWRMSLPPEVLVFIHDSRQHLARRASRRRRWIYVGVGLGVLALMTFPIAAVWRADQAEALAENVTLLANLASQRGAEARNQRDEADTLKALVRVYAGRAQIAEDALRTARATLAGRVSPPWWKAPWDESLFVYDDARSPSDNRDAYYELLNEFDKKLLAARQLEQIAGVVTPDDLKAVFDRRVELHEGGSLTALTEGVVRHAGRKMDEGHVERAIDALEDTFSTIGSKWQHQPACRVAATALAGIHLEIGDAGSALEVAHKCLSKADASEARWEWTDDRGDFARLQVRRARAEMLLGPRSRLALVHSELDALAREQPGLSEAHQWLAEVSAILGLATDAARSTARFAELARDDTEAVTHLRRVVAGLERGTHARLTVEDPDAYFHGHLWLASLSGAWGDKREAGRQLDLAATALSRLPPGMRQMRRAELSNGRARHLADLQRLSEAVEEATVAVETAADDVARATYINTRLYLQRRIGSNPDIDADLRRFAELTITKRQRATLQARRHNEIAAAMKKTDALLWGTIFRAISGPSGRGTALTVNLGAETGIRVGQSGDIYCPAGGQLPGGTVTVVRVTAGSATAYTDLPTDKIGNCRDLRIAP